MSQLPGESVHGDLPELRRQLGVPGRGAGLGGEAVVDVDLAVELSMGLQEILQCLKKAICHFCHLLVESVY